MKTYNFHVEFHDAEYAARTDGTVVKLTKKVGSDGEVAEGAIDIPLHHWPELRERLNQIFEDVTKPESSQWGSSG